MIQANRQTRPLSPQPQRKLGEDGGPNTPEIERPAAPNELMKRLKKVDPDQARKYRQRSGQ